MARGKKGVVDRKVILWYSYCVIIANIENTILEYEGEGNVIILPITQFVRKDGNLAVTSENTKLFIEKYPSLPKKWGYMVSNGVPYPSFGTSGTGLMGIANKPHYASAYRWELYEEGMWYVAEQALMNPNTIFYIPEEDFIDASKLKSIFENLENVVYLRKGEVNNERTTAA